MGSTWLRLRFCYGNRRATSFGNPQKAGTYGWREEDDSLLVPGSSTAFRCATHRLDYSRALTR
jgi:hypothetical protein